MAEIFIYLIFVCNVDDSCASCLSVFMCVRCLLGVSAATLLVLLLLLLLSFHALCQGRPFSLERTTTTQVSLSTSSLSHNKLSLQGGVFRRGRVRHPSPKLAKQA